MTACIFPDVRCEWYQKQQLLTHETCECTLHSSMVESGARGNDPPCAAPKDQGMHSMSNGSTPSCSCATGICTCFVGVEDVVCLLQITGLLSETGGGPLLYFFGATFLICVIRHLGLMIARWA